MRGCDLNRYKRVSNSYRINKTLDRINKLLESKMDFTKMR